MALKIYIEKEEELQKALDKYIKENGDKMVEQTLDKYALLIESDAKRRTPVDTGRLRASITVETPFKKGERIIGTNTDYAPHVEFGTRFMKGRAFLFPAYDKNIKPFLKALKKVLNKVK